MACSPQKCVASDTVTSQLSFLETLGVLGPWDSCSLCF